MLELNVRIKFSILKFGFPLLFSILLTGCMSTHIPQYIQDKKPYVKRYYATYDQAYAAVEQVLSGEGWVIESTLDPTIYEYHKSTDLDEDHILFIAKSNETSLLFFKRYQQVNIYLRSKKGQSELEIRYRGARTFLIGKTNSYKNDEQVKGFLQKIEKILN